MKSCIKHAFAVLSSFTALFALLFSPVICSGNLLAPGDAWYLSTPYFFASPHFWTDRLLSGFFLVGDPQVQTFYPLRYLFGNSPESFNAFVIAAYVLSASFAYGLSLRLTGSKCAAAFGGICYGMSGFLISNLCHIPMIHTACFFPLIIWSIEELKDKWNPPWFFFGSSALGLAILAGHAQLSVYALYLAFFYLLLLSVRQRNARLFGTGLLMLGIGILLAAIQICPSAELAATTMRNKISFEVFTSYSLLPIDLVALIYPFIFGGAALTNSIYPHYFGSSNLQTVTSFSGILPLGLVAFTLICSWKKDPAVWFWIAVAIFSILFALGAFTPLAMLLYMVPGYNLFRVPTRHFMGMSLAFSILSGYGIALIQSGQLRTRELIISISIILFVIFAAVIALFFNADAINQIAMTNGAGPSFVSMNNPAIVSSTVLFVFAAIAMFIASKTKLSSLKTQVLLSLLLVVDLGSHAVLAEWRFDCKPKPYLVAPEYVVAHANELKITGQRITSFRGVQGAIAELPPNFSLLWNCPSATAYQPLISRKYFELTGFPAGGMLLSPPMSGDRSLDLLAVRYVFTSKNEADTFSWLPSLDDDNSRWLRSDFGKCFVYENKKACPRAWLVSTVHHMNEQDILKTIKTGWLPDGNKFEPTNSGLLDSESADASLMPPQKGNVIAQPIPTIKQLDENRIRLSVNCLEKGLLILSQRNFPGWTARVDGVEQKIFEVDYVLSGLAIAKGEHTVELAFESKSVVVGAIISGTSFLLLILFCIFSYMRMRRRNQPLNT